MKFEHNVIEFCKAQSNLSNTPETQAHHKNNKQHLINEN